MRLVWASALISSVVLSIFAVFRGAYIGPDYYTHFARLTEWKKVVDFGGTNPPGYYLVGYGLFKLIGPRNAFPITLSILQVFINAVALWRFFIYSESRLQSRLLHLALVFFLTFLPVRVIHAASLGTDWATIPFFVLVLFAFDKFRSDTTATYSAAALFGVVLGVATFTKYSFMALLPAALLAFVCIAWNRRWKLARFLTICLLALFLSSAVAAASFWASSRVHGYNTEKHWLPKGNSPEINFADLLTLNKNDVRLFRAPEYFKREILVPHKYSYLALSHLGIFTDTMNIFQDLTVPQHFGGILIPDQKARRSWKTPVMQASMATGTIWTLLALGGTAWGIWLAIKHLLRDKLEREDVAAIFAIAFFLLMFVPIPFVQGGAMFGYWTPRLILPSLLYFFWGAFLLIDRTAAGRQIIPVAAFLLVLIQCTFEVLMLI